MSKTWGREDFGDEVQRAIARSDALREKRGGNLTPLNPDQPMTWERHGETQVIEGGLPPLKKACHKMPAATVGRGIYLTASVDLQDAIEQIHPRLILDCRNLTTLQLTYTPQASVGAGPRSLVRIVARNLPPVPAIVRIAWPDYGLPPLGPRFFVDVARWASGRPILCVCMGGHGRSGTAAAALLVGYGMRAQDAIAAVRAKHCRQAIETAKQVQFIGLVEQARRGRR